MLFIINIFIYSFAANPKSAYSLLKLGFKIFDEYQNEFNYNKSKNYFK